MSAKKATSDARSDQQRAIDLLLAEVKQLEAEVERLEKCVPEECGCCREIERQQSAREAVEVVRNHIMGSEGLCQAIKHHFGLEA